MRVGIIILSWNSKSLISNCLEGLIKFESYPIYIVDNDSEDGSAEFIKKTHPAVKLIQSPMNLGFAGGNNLGIKHALADGCDAVFLLNNDTIIDESFIKPCVTILKENPCIGIVGPVVVEGNDPEIIQCKGGKISLWGLDFSYIGQGEKYEKSNLCETVDYVLGAAMLIRRELLEQIGSLDPEYFPAYVEEADYCYRAKLAGYSSAITHAARVRHIGDSSSGSYENSFRRFTANRFLFGLKHLNGMQFFVSGQIILWKVFLKKCLKGIS